MVVTVGYSSQYDRMRCLNNDISNASGERRKNVVLFVGRPLDFSLLLGQKVMQVMCQLR